MINVRLCTRKDLSSNWEIVNPILLDGEQIIVLDDDTKNIRYKTGDGTTPYNELPFDDGVLRQMINNKTLDIIDDGVLILT